MNSISPQFGEAERIAALRRLDILDTPAEPEYDELVELAAAVCEVPISLLSFIDDRRQWNKAAIGVVEPVQPLATALSQHTLHHPDVLVVEDTREDPFTVGGAADVGDSPVRFYAGVAIRTHHGVPVGTLCIGDFVPRRMSDIQTKTLKVLARQATARLELREQRLQLQRALVEAETAKDRSAISDARFKAFMNGAPFFAYLKDPEGRFLFYNRVIADHFGVSSDEWLGKSDHDLFPPDLAAVYRANDVAVIQSGKTHAVEETTVQGDGSTLHWRSYKFPCEDQTGTLLGGISINITEDVRLNAELHRSTKALESANLRLSELATTDALTQLPNRRAFDERLVAEFASARRSQRPLSIMLLDIDHFKQHNDRFGHDAGDNTLRRFAALLREVGRLQDLFARYGGEEFIFLLPDTDEVQANDFGQRVLRLLRSADWPVQPVTASAGIASITPATPGPTHLVTLADEALYVAKRSGKDRIVTYSSYSKQIGVHVEIPASRQEATGKRRGRAT